MKLFTLNLPHSDEEVHYRDYRINGHKFAFDRIQYNKGGLHNMERIAVPVISKSDGEPVANLETTVILVECGNIYHYLDNGFAVRLSDAQMVTVANEILKKRAEVRGTGLKTLSGWREYRHFNPDDVYNNKIDCPVVGWMPLPEKLKKEEPEA